MKRIIAVILAVLMLASLAACSKAPTDDNETSTTTAATQGGSGDDTTAAADTKDIYRYLEGVSFTTIVNSNNVEFPEGQDINDNQCYRKWQLQHGIETKVEWTASGDAFTQKKNAVIASGDIPDMMEVDLMQYTQLVKSGLIADLTDVIDEWLCPELKASYAAGDNKDLVAVTVNGRIYGLPQTNGVGDGSPLFWIRKDWLDKLGLEEPTCIADIAVIAKAFMEQDPDGNGKDDTYGLPILPEYAATYGGNGNLGDIFVNVGGAAPYQWRVQEDGTVIYGSLMDGAKEALELLNGWYEEGIIPADFATWDSTQYSEALASGRAGIGLGPWWAGWGFPTDSARLDENAEWVTFALPEEPGGQLYSQARSPAGLSIMVVNKDYATPEDFIILANRVYTAQPSPYGDSAAIIAKLIEEGYAKDEEEYNTSYDSLEKLRPYHGSTAINMFEGTTKGLNKYLNGDFASDEEYSQFLVDSGVNPGEVTLALNTAKSCKKYLDTEDGRHNAMDLYGTYVSRVTGCTALFDRDDPAEFVMTDYSGTVPSMTTYKNFLDTFEEEAYTNMIMGNTGGQTISEYFDAFVASYLAQGGAEITAEVQAEIDAR